MVKCTGWGLCCHIALKTLCCLNVGERECVHVCVRVGGQGWRGVRLESGWESNESHMDPLFVVAQWMGWEWRPGLQSAGPD